nr:lysozyme [Limnephilus flavicornis]
MKFVIVVLFALVALQSASAKIFTRCDLAKELQRQGFARATLENWVCLVEAESSRNTAVKGGPNSNGSYDWGLYQINDGFWCKPGVVAGDCKAKCESFITDDITLASTCAKLIYARHGYKAWYGWTAKCQGALPDLSSCGL